MIFTYICQNIFIVQATCLMFVVVSGFHRRDDDQVDAVRDQHLHRQPGHGRHVGDKTIKLFMTVISAALSSVKL
jgi:hypothetical protein